jgi:arginine exporter protein ArgO
LAGFGIAIPIGPIGILIFELGTRRGFAVAFSAGAGAASADLIYATIAVLAGNLIASVLMPYSTILRVSGASSLVLLGIGLLYHELGHQSTNSRLTRSLQGSCFRMYAIVLGLTLLNPVTVTYFTTLILGMGALNSGYFSLAFVAGAFLASFSWQTLLASASSLAHRRLSTRLQAATFTLGNLMIIAIGIAVFLGLV